MTVIESKQVHSNQYDEIINMCNKAWMKTNYILAVVQQQVNVKLVLLVVQFHHIIIKDQLSSKHKKEIKRPTTDSGTSTNKKSIDKN